MTVPEPVERCGYVVTPVPNHAGAFLPLVHNMRVSRDGQWTMLPARLYDQLTDEQFTRIMPQLFWQPEAPYDKLIATALTTRIVVPRESVEDEATLAHSIADMMNQPPPRRLTQQEIEANRARLEHERAARLDRLQAEWQELVDQYAHVPAVLAVLDVHRPSRDLIGECTHPVSGWDADSEDWPCTTIEAIKGAPS